MDNTADENDRVDACVYFCFILENLGELSESVIGEIILSCAQTQYFEIMGSIGFMLEKGLIGEKKDPKSGETVYFLQEEGSEIARSLGSHLSPSLREITVATGIELLSRNERERSIRCRIDYDRKKDSYDLEVQFLNELNGDTIMSLTLYAPDRKKAEEMRERFLSKPSLIITRIMNMFLKDDFFMFDQ